MEFVVCDDEVVFRKNVIKIIDKLLIKNDIDYKIYEFEKYDKSFEKLIKTKSRKIYILDIEMKDEISGIDIARKIRKYDWNSFIIIATSHYELTYQAVKARIMMLDFISKFDNCNKELTDSIEKAIGLVNSNNVIKINSNGVTYVVYMDDILFVERDTIDRKCIIRTSTCKIPVSKNLNEMYEILNNHFYQTHRSCIVNTANIVNVDWKNNIIYFDNNISIDLLSRSKKKGLKSYVRD